MHIKQYTSHLVFPGQKTLLKIIHFLDEYSSTLKQKRPKNSLWSFRLVNQNFASPSYSLVTSTCSVITRFTENLRANSLLPVLITKVGWMSLPSFSTRTILV